MRFIFDNGFKTYKGYILQTCFEGIHVYFRVCLDITGKNRISSVTCVCPGACPTSSCRRRSELLPQLDGIVSFIELGWSLRCWWNDVLRRMLSHYSLYNIHYVSLCISWWPYISLKVINWYKHLSLWTNLCTVGQFFEPFWAPSHSSLTIRLMLQKSCTLQFCPMIWRCFNRLHPSISMGFFGPIFHRRISSLSALPLEAAWCKDSHSVLPPPRDLAPAGKKTWTVLGWRSIKRGCCPNHHPPKKNWWGGRF